MALYEAKRRLYDMENGLILDRGSIVRTDEEAWVKRFGPNLKRVSSVPSGIEPVTIEGTVEQKALGKSAPVVEEYEEASEDVAARKPLVTRLAKRTEDKVVAEDDSEIKFDV